MRSLFEDLLHIVSHIKGIKHLIALVQNETFEVTQVQQRLFGRAVAELRQLQNSAWGADDDMEE